MPRLSSTLFGGSGPWGPAERAWGGGGPEWDIVAESGDRSAVLLGEAKWKEGPVSLGDVRRMFRELAAMGTPELHHRRVHAVFVPRCSASVKRQLRGLAVIDARDVIEALR